MLKFIQTHSMGGDCTAPYDVELDRPYTVREFINEILAASPHEWGEIRVVGCFSIKYRYGKIEDIIPARYADLSVSEVKASGGYSAMNYRIKLSEWTNLSSFTLKH